MRALRRAGATYASVLYLGTLLLYELSALVFRHHATVDALEGDEREYWDLATAIRDHGAGGISARRTLPYPLLLAGIRAIVGDDVFHVQLVLSALLAALPAVTYLVVLRRLDDQRVARVAGLLCALWPVFVRYSATIYSDSLGLLTFAVFLLAIPPPARDEPTAGFDWAGWVLAGLMLGVAIQVKPLYLVYLAFIPVVAMAAGRLARHRIAAALCLSVACAAALLPWSAYISQREGQVIVVSANGGETLAGGLNPVLLRNDSLRSVVTAEGRSTWVGPGKWLMVGENGYLTPAEANLPYAQMSALLGARSRDWIVSHPREVAYLSMRKLTYMWGIYPFWNGIAQSLGGNIPLLGLVALAGYGLWRGRESLVALAPFCTLPFFCSAVALVSWGSWRFRMAADLGLIVLASLPWKSRMNRPASGSHGRTDAMRRRSAADGPPVEAPEQRS